MNLNDLFEMAEKHARHVMIGTTRQLIPVFAMVDKDGSVRIVGVPLDSPKTKDAAAIVVKAMLRAGECSCYSFVSEAWAVTRGPDYDEEATDAVPPSECDDRREIVMITGEDCHTEKIRTFAIKRDREGRCVALEREPDIEQTIPLKGRFSNMMPHTGH